MTVYELIQEIIKKFAQNPSTDIAFELLHKANIAPMYVEDMYIDYLNKQKEVTL